MNYEEQLKLKKLILHDRKNKDNFVSVLFQNDIRLTKEYLLKAKNRWGKCKQAPKMKIKDFFVPDHIAKIYYEYSYVRDMKEHFYNFAVHCDLQDALHPVNTDWEAKKKQAEFLMDICNGFLDVYYVRKMDQKTTENLNYMKELVNEVCTFNQNQLEGLVVGKLIQDMELFSFEEKHNLQGIGEECRAKNELGMEFFSVL